MRKISNWYNRVHKIYQQQITGGYDTYCHFRKSKGGKRLEHKKARRKLERFYDGFEEFVNRQK